MNFTREPIIETVITPREGCKLVIRSSKGNGQEDYFVDAIEVVSFGHSFFFRSLERPKSFLLPMSDYEILETKETRMVLKNVSSDRSIKIGGGREVPPPRREAETKEEDHLADSRPAPERQPLDRKRDKRRRGRRGRDRPDQPHDQRMHQPEIKERAEGESEGSTEPLEVHSEPSTNEFENRPKDRSQQSRGRQGRGNATPSEDIRSGQDNGGSNSSDRNEEKAPSFISKLFPPPPTLIKESLSRYKTAEESSEEIQPSSSGEKSSRAPQIPPLVEKSFEETIIDRPIEERTEDENEE